MPPKAAPAAAKSEAKAKPKAKGKSKAEKEEDEGPKMSPPDKDEFDAALAEIQKTIEDLQAQQVALGNKINERSGGKDEYFKQRNDYRAQLDEFTAKIDALMARKEEINKGINEKKAEGATMRNELSKMKKSIGYTNEADIDNRIEIIERTLVTESLSLKQEKDYLREIQELKRNRPKVGQYHKMEDSLANRDTGANLRDNIALINEEMALYKEGKRGVSKLLAELNESRKDQLGDLPKCIEERDAIGKKIKEEFEKRNALRDEFRQKEREFNQWKNERRKAQQDKYNEEREKKQAEWQRAQLLKKAEAMDIQPHVAEITLIEQTILFCKSLVQDKGAVVKEEKKEISHSNPDGTEILLRKEDREEEYYYAPTAQKKKGKAKNKGTKEGAKPIKHNAETFKLFDQLKLSAPITTEDIPATLEKLEEQLEGYKEKVKAWEKSRDEKKQKILAGQYTEDDEEDAEEKAAEEEKEGQEDEKEDGEEK